MTYTFSKIDTARALEFTRAAGRIAVRAGKSAGNFAGGMAVLAIGGAVAFKGLHGVRLPDHVLLQRAIEVAAARPTASPSALEQRDSFLGTLAIGAFLLFAGFAWLREWWKNPTAKPAPK